MKVIAYLRHGWISVPMGLLSCLCLSSSATGAETRQTGLTPDEQKVIEEYRILNEQLQLCSKFKSALSEAKRAADYSFAPNHSKGEGCIIAPPDFTFQALQTMALGTALFLSIPGKIVVGSLVTEIERLGTHWCVKPITEARNRYDALLDAAQESIKALEQGRYYFRAELPTLKDKMELLSSIDAGSNPFQSARFASNQEAIRHYNQCAAQLR